MKPKQIEILRPGTFTSMQGQPLTFTSADLADIAASYRPTAHEAPIVIGHPKANAPAFGWVSGLSVCGDRLVADVGQVNADFADMVAKGAFKKLSPSFFGPTHPNSPTPGKWYLRHVGFLGAQAPAIKGLRDAEFADDAATTLEFGDRWTWPLGSITDALRRLRDYFVEKEGAEKGDQILPLWMLDSVTSAVAEERARESAETGMAPAFADAAAAAPDDARIAQKLAELAERETRVAASEAAAAARDREAAQSAERAEVASFCDGLVSQGRLLPREVSIATAVFASLQAGEVSFADGDETRAMEPKAALKKLLSERPPVIEFGERSREVPAVACADFAAPRGDRVSEVGLMLHRKALAWTTAQQSNDYLTAVRAVSQEGS